MSTSPFGSDGLTATGRVPAEHRVFGLDRRTLVPGLAVIAVFLIWVVVVPAINGLLSYGQTTRAGDVFALGPGFTMDAQPGWGVESGLLTGDRTRSHSAGEGVLLVNGGLSFRLTIGPYDGSLSRLLSQIEKVTTAEVGHKAFTVAGEVGAFRTDQGTRGLAQPYTTVNGGGVVAALEFPGVGIQITAAGTDPAQLKAKADQVASMIDSVRHSSGATGGS